MEFKFLQGGDGAFLGDGVSLVRESSFSMNEQEIDDTET